MKTVYFIRHAKSSWSDMSLRDHDRPLNSRGLRDAPFMAKLIAGKEKSVDFILSSSANRALTTARYFKDELGLKDNQLIIKSEIYEAWAETVLSVINEVDNDANTILVFGHNPTFTTIANFYTEDYIPNVPTCGIVKVEFHVKKWGKISKENGKLKAFYFPKQYFN